uniref:Rac GTPase-activating protein 1 n=1 Tax=Myripristis murdjan TaxID=586833 RepID=A0A667XQ52_9TELE
MESSVLNLHNQFQSLRAHADVLNEGIEPQFIQMAMNFEECRKKWLQVAEDLGACKEVLAKAETERGALEVKLKHARNQVDVEIRRRQRAEADYEKLERQLQLIRELLISENNSSSVHLSEEQRSALAFLSAHSQAAQASKANLNSSRRSEPPARGRIKLHVHLINKSSSLSTISSIHQIIFHLYLLTGFYSFQMNESVVAKTTITVPVNGGPVEAVSTIETVPYWTRSKRKSGENILDLFILLLTPATETYLRLSCPPHTKVIRSEFCVPCGRRTKFGKVYLRCQDCRVVTHPECRDRCPVPCNPIAISTPIRDAESTLADFAPDTAPMIPALVIYCIKEIEHRGLHEVGLYRISGTERLVKELKDKLLRGKTLPSLSKVEDINVITGVLKDFLRNLPEPLLTFHLNKAFMDTAEIPDDDNSLAMLYRAISELPQPNRDTLACLMIHLQKVSQCVDTKMDVNNLARVFGPTLVGHAVPNPDPMTILQDTSRQPRIIERLLSIPSSYWSQYAHPEITAMDNAQHMNTPDHKVSILGPVTTPERMMTKTPSSSSLSQRMMQTLSSTTIFGSKNKPSTTSSRQVSFFASPQLK